MVAHSKHHKPVRRKHSRTRPAKGNTERLRPTAELSPRPPAQEDDFPKEDEEPKPEDLAKEEEALKAEEAAAVPEVELGEQTRTRERSSYDGDTAIKLYLREIGQ